MVRKSGVTAQNQSYTFTWTLTDGYTGSHWSDYFAINVNIWESHYDNSDPRLWETVSGQELTGTSTQSSERMSASSSGFCISAENLHSEQGIGLTADGSAVTELAAASLNIGAMDYSETLFVNPVTWLQQNGKIGHTFDTPGGQIVLRAAGEFPFGEDTYLEFTPTSVTFAAIPEPAAVSTTIVTALAALFIHRRCRATLPRR